MQRRSMRTNRFGTFSQGAARRRNEADAKVVAGDLAGALVDYRGALLAAEQATPKNPGFELKLRHAIASLEAGQLPDPKVMLRTNIGFGAESMMAAERIREAGDLVVARAKYLEATSFLGASSDPRAKKLERHCKRVLALLDPDQDVVCVSPSIDPGGEAQRAAATVTEEDLDAFYQSVERHHDRKLIKSIDAIDDGKEGSDR